MLRQRGNTEDALLDATADLLFEAFRAAGADEGLVYLSVPITSGRRELQLLRSLQVTRDDLQRSHRDQWLSEVLEENERAAQVSASRARELFPHQVVVNPAHLHVPGWSQLDYGDFWDELVRRYAVRVVVADGWEYSRGARREVALALRLGVPVLDLMGGYLTAEEVERVDRSARGWMLEQGFPQATTDAYLEPLAVDFGGLDRQPDAVEAQRAASEVFAWLRGERTYQLQKFGTDLDDEHTLQGFGDDSWWWRQLTTYFHRARVLGVEHAAGRQALAKFVATGCGLLESVVRLHGHLPAPGVPSGENIDRLGG